MPRGRPKGAVDTKPRKNGASARRKSGANKSGTSRRSGYNRSYYVANRNKILKYMHKRYRAKRSSILAYQKKYRKRTKNKGPLYMQGRKSGKRPLYGRLPRVHQYKFIRGGKVGKGPKTSTGTARRGRGSNSSTGGRRPMGGGRTQAFKSKKK